MPRCRSVPIPRRAEAAPPAPHLPPLSPRNAAPPQSPRNAAGTMPLPFNKSLDIKLLKLVKENPIIYDLKHMKYMDFDSREVVWQKIGDELNRPACQFAGLQCQIQYGDYQEEKHKTGYMEDYKELLPSNISNKSGLEKKIIREHMKHQGLSSLEAKHLYNKTARELPTYGVTFFVVKEKQQKGKKKLVPRLLGISANAVLRLDEESKEILQAWPLTQVKSYQVGKAHTFTLDFGDYSDKEYSVKTNDAVRIRDILQGYIDIIAKSLGGAYNTTMNEGQVVMEDNVHAARGNIVQLVQNNPSKVVEESFIGPTKIVTYEPGQTVSHGTQLVTVQQVIISNKMANQQYTLTGEVPHRQGMPLEFVRKLNRMNSNSVKVVNLITSDDGPHTAELTSIVKTMEKDLPLIETGVNGIVKTADMDEEAKRRLLAELQELTDFLNSLTKHVHGPNPESDEALEAASKIADVSTQMYLGLDPLTKRRSNLIKMSRESFIEDEKVVANLRRASFASAAGSACAAVDRANALISQAYAGAPLMPSEVEHLENGARDKMRKLNGAVALFLTAHADLENVDYSAAVTSMNTINELISELVKDAQALATVKDGDSKQELINDTHQLCEATKLVCSLSGSADQQRKQDVINAYAPAADKLIFTFGRGRRDDKDNRIIDLAKDVGEKTSIMLMKANDLAGLLPEPRAASLDEAGVQCAAAGSDLLACAMLTSSCIHEPHCQSALTASAETLASSAQRLLLVVKPALEDEALRSYGDELKARSLTLANALDALKNAYGDENPPVADVSAVKDPHRLKFLMRLNEAKRNSDEVVQELNKPLASSKKHPPSPVVAAMLEKTLALKMADYSAAVAELLLATSDRDNQDFATAEAAIVKIYEALPVIVKDTKALAATKDEATRQAMLDDVRRLCDDTRRLCTSSGEAHVSNLYKEAAALADTSNKLCFTFNWSAPHNKQQEVMDIVTAACAKASVMLSNVDELAKHTSAAHGELLDSAGANVAERAKTLLTCAQLTAACTSSPAYRSCLLPAADALSTSSQELTRNCSAVQSPLVDTIAGQQRELEAELDKLRKACGGGKGICGSEERERLQFVKSAAAAKTELLAIEHELDQPYTGSLAKGEALSFRQLQLSNGLARLNAALAALTAANSDLDNTDFAAAEKAIRIIHETLPQVVKDTRVIAADQDNATREAMLSNARALCLAASQICDHAEKDPKALRQCTENLAAASGKLIFMVNPRAKQNTGHQVMEFTQAACKTASQLVKTSSHLADQLAFGDGVRDKIMESSCKTADAADALMTAAQLTSPCISDPGCQATLSTSIDALSTSAQELTRHCSPLLHGPLLTAHIKQLEMESQQLTGELNNLKSFCQDPEKDHPSTGRTAEEEAQRLQFVKSAAAAETGLIAIEKELDKPFSSQHRDKLVLTRQSQLSDAMARLASAIATLTAATTDPDKPDYAAAEEAMAVITELMPLVVMDTKAMAGSKDEKMRDAIMGELRALCAATRDLCHARDPPHELREAAKKFGAASGKLVYILNPRTRPDDANKVIKHANLVCNAASQLVKESNKLSDSLYATDLAAELLKKAGARTLDSVDALLTATQLTAPSLNDPRCQAVLLSSLEALSMSGEQLGQQWAPLQAADKVPLVRKLDARLADLLRRIRDMRDDCLGDYVCPMRIKGSQSEAHEPKRVRFADAVATTKTSVRDIEQELTKPYTGSLARGESLSFRQLQLSNGLARLNAALAALAVATSDLDNPDYAAAGGAMTTIRETLPQVVEGTKALAAVRDGASGEAMLGNVRALCLATSQICEHAEEDPKTLRQFAKNFATASGKLIYGANARARQTAHQVMESTQAACKTASQLVKTSSRLADQLAPGDGVRDKITESGCKTADAADVLMTAAQLTSPTINDAHCQVSFSTSIDSLSSSTQELKSHWLPLLQEPLLTAVIRQLEKENQQLSEELGHLKDFCQDPKKGANDAKADYIKKKEAQRLQYIRKGAAAKEAMIAAEKELDKPVAGSPAKGEAASAQRSQLTHQLAKLHAALLSLSIATSDNNNPDYATAEKSIDTITEVLPHVLKNTNTFVAGEDSARQTEHVAELRALVQGAQDICGSVQQQDSAKLNDLLTKNMIPRLGKLYYVVHPKTGSVKLGKVESLAKVSGSKASEVLTSVFQLAEAAGPAGLQLDQQGAATADAAKALLTAVQLTGPYIHEPEAQSTLISVADALSSSAQDLAAVWTPIIQEPGHKAVGEKLTRDLDELEIELEKFRKACRELEPEKIVHKPATKPKPPAPPRWSSDEEARLKQFPAALEKVAAGLRAAEEDINRVYKSTLDAPKMHQDQMRGVQKGLEKKIALCNVATSSLLACNATEPMDYATAAKSTTNLATLLPKIAQDAKVLSNEMPEKQRKAFLDDILAMFDGTKKIIDAAQNNRYNLNDVAVEYGNRSGALLYSVCTDFDPSHEKEVISRAKAIGECISSLTESSAKLFSAVPEGDDMLCARGKACVTAAGNLVFTAKLVAPSIQVQECREILMETSEALSSRIKAFASSWRPLSAEPHHSAVVKELDVITAKAEGLLEELKKDLDSGKLVKMRPLELLVLEDTPLRRMTAALIDSAMKKSTNTSLPEQKRAYVEYARRLTAASDQLDRANALCKKAPHDLEKRSELEEAVQNLMLLALQSRPSLTDQRQQFIVDLTEYVKELSQEADKMCSASTSCSVKHKEIEKSCQEITEEAERIMNPSNHHVRGDDTTVDDIHEVDKFGRTAESRVRRIGSEIQAMPDSKDKILLTTQSVNLEDSCNILRFASQSAIAAAQSAAMDDTLRSLVDLETRSQLMLEHADRQPRYVNEPIPWAVRSSLLQATRSISSSPHLCSSLMQYIEEQRTRTDLRDPEAKKRLEEHLRKLKYFLRVLTVETGRRVATWQEPDGPEVATAMEQVIRELDHGCPLNQPKKEQNSVLQHIDMNRLLLSSDVIKIEGDRKHVEDKLQQSATKLSSMLSTVMSSISKPESLARSLSVTADAAGELAAVARAAKSTGDPIYNGKIEEAVRDVTFQTYNVLKASELVSQEPNFPAHRRRLLDASRLLNDALNKLGRTTSPERKLQRECSELTRNLQFNQVLSQTAQPTCALPYADCLDALVTQQEVIQKLSSDQPMTKEEFSRTLSYVSSAVCNSTELASHCGYLMSLGERDKEAAKVGVVNVQLLKKVTETAQATCYRVLQFDAEQAKEEAVQLIGQTQAIREALQDAEKKSQHLKEEIRSVARDLIARASDLEETLTQPDKAKITVATRNLLDGIQTVSILSEHPSLLPASGDLTEDQKQLQQRLLTAARDLTNKTVSLVRDVKIHADRHSDDDDKPMTWVTFNLKRKDVIKAFEDLLASVRENGERAGILQVEQKEEEPPKSFVQIQVELANKWLKRPNCKPEVKASGEEAVGNVIDLAEKMVADMKESEREDMCVMISETKRLLSECSEKCTPDKASLLVDRLQSLKKAIERSVITMVVEDFIEEEEPLQDLEVLADSESDVTKRKFILERKIAELLAQLGRVTRSARVVARVGLAAPHAQLELDSYTEQANLLAPHLVKAAQERIDSPDNKAAIENYKSMLAQYAASLSKVRELCDQSVDPMEFVQTAGETMQRMREDSTHDNDPQKCELTSSAITKLANRVIHVSMSSSNAKQDPELRKALSEAQQRLLATVPGPQTRRSRIPDWKDTTAEILRTTEKVEAVMGGELIFQSQPQSDQPIFAAARDLHTVVREWSARDNEIVAVAKRTAVLMAKLSAHMNNNAQHALLVTSQQLVQAARELATLARKLALDCNDVRIKTNLLQVCDQIPTISGQLKMLTTVKGSSLNSGNKEDQESLNMLVDNAQNLMLSIQQVVKVSAGASVKIASQCGGMRVRWVRKTYY